MSRPEDPATRRLEGRLRRFALAAATLAGVPRGVFIPYRHAGRLSRGGSDAYPEIGAWLARHEEIFRTVLARIDDWSELLQGFDGPPPHPRWSQDWFPRLDGAAAYALVRARQPARIVEVGSGHSTRFLTQAVHDEGLPTRVTCIDPRPRAQLRDLGVVHLPSLLQQAGRDAFDALLPGDMLVIDSSHVLVPGSDVDMLFGRILPSLAKGVLVHVHDVFLPDGYPADWAWRGYNEQSAVAALLAGGGFRPIFASHYVATRMVDTVARTAAGTLPLPEGAFESSLWLEKLSMPLAVGANTTGFGGPSCP